MKTLAIILSSFLAMIPTSVTTYSPYTIGLESAEGVDVLRPKLEAQLKANGFNLIGRTQPASDKDRWVLAVTYPDLDKAVQTAQGSSGYASVLRVALTQEGSKTIVSYMTPEYWGNAYFQKKYSAVSADLAKVNTALKASFAGLGSYSGKQFGSKNGLKADKLQKYQYMMGMPSFDDPVVLRTFDSHQEAVARIDANISKGIPNVTKVYKHKVPGHNVTLYGFALSGPKGEKNFLPTIDIGTPKHTAFLPYEVLVKNGEVQMLHGRYRIALSFPDLTMGTFMKIMSAPGDIEDLLKQVVE